MEPLESPQASNPENEKVTWKDVVQEVPTKTKIKVVLAFVVVSLSAYVGFWVQEPVENIPPSQIQADVLNSSGNSQENSAAKQVAVNSDIQKEEKVSIANFAYDPETLTVDKGTKVTWTN